MFIPEFLFLKFLFIGLFIYLLENIFESTVVSLQDSVFSTQIKWIVSIKSVFEASMSESFD